MGTIGVVDVEVDVDGHGSIHFVGRNTSDLGFQRSAIWGIWSAAWLEGAVLGSWNSTVSLWWPQGVPTGSSAGGAVAVAALQGSAGTSALADGAPLVTGVALPDGTLMAVGGVSVKHEAAAKAGFTLFVGGQGASENACAGVAGCAVANTIGAVLGDSTWGQDEAERRLGSGFPLSEPDAELLDRLLSDVGQLAAPPPPGYVWKDQALRHGWEAAHYQRTALEGNPPDLRVAEAVGRLREISWLLARETAFYHVDAPEPGASSERCDSGATPALPAPPQTLWAAMAHHQGSKFAEAGGRSQLAGDPLAEVQAVALCLWSTMDALAWAKMDEAWGDVGTSTGSEHVIQHLREPLLHSRRLVMAIEGTPRQPDEFLEGSPAGDMAHVFAALAGESDDLGDVGEAPTLRYLQPPSGEQMNHDGLSTARLFARILLDNRSSWSSRPGAADELWMGHLVAATLPRLDAPPEAAADGPIPTSPPLLLTILFLLLLGKIRRSVRTGPPAARAGRPSRRHAWNSH